MKERERERERERKREREKERERVTPKSSPPHSGHTGDRVVDACDVEHVGDSGDSATGVSDTMSNGAVEKQLGGWELLGA